MIYFLAVIYLIVGMVVLYKVSSRDSVFTDLKESVFSGFETISFEYLRRDSLKDKIYGVLGFILLVLSLGVLFCIYPIVVGVRIYNAEDKSLIPQKFKMRTVQEFDPVSKNIIQESDYKLFGLLLVQKRKFTYDRSGYLSMVQTYDKNNKWCSTTQYFYNDKGQRYLETQISNGSKRESKEYHIFSNANKIVATYGELESGHKYCHEFHYNTNGEKFTTSMSNLGKSGNIVDIYYNALSDYEHETRIKFRGGFNGMVSETVHPWSCQICDGDYTTGCLFYDPTECPRY
jgi:hypothetical protein